jgi:hypothetical protein
VPWQLRTNRRQSEVTAVARHRPQQCLRAPADSAACDGPVNYAASVLGERCLAPRTLQFKFEQVCRTGYWDPNTRNSSTSLTGHSEVVC